MLNAEPLFPLVLLLACSAFVVVLWTRTPSTSSSVRLPPGPKPLPVVGNLFDMPTRNMAPVLHELSSKYGDVVYLNILGRPTVVIGSYDAAVALLETRSANTSDRPRLVMAELSGLMWEFVLMCCSQRWRQCRRTFHEFFHQGVVARYRPVHLRGVRRFYSILRKTFLRTYTTGATIMDVIYGFDGSEKNSKYISIAERAALVFGAIVIPGRFLVELFPVLAHVPKWLPGAKFKADADVWKQDVLALREIPFDAAVKAMETEHARPSIISTLMTNASQVDGNVAAKNIEHIKDVAGVAYAAGADTTSSSLAIFFLYMALHPHIQQKAQKDLDAVVGSDRLPNFDDYESLPYVSAIVKECSRWCTVVPLGLPHQSTEDEVYNGFVIPAGSVLIPNAWAMAKDPAAYPDPEKFMPERFLKDGKLDPSVRDPLKFQFGFGRRICPGRFFATEAMFIIVASVLHAFTIHPPRGPDGKPVRIEPKIPLDYAIAHPDPFRCVITPRSEKMASLIRQPEGYGDE